LFSLYKDGKYSDLTIVCGESTYRAHKAVLCTRSQFFAKACDGAFQEASTGVIDLSQDDPQAVKMMMHYFYHLDYPHVAMHESAVDDHQPVANGNKASQSSPSDPVIDAPPSLLLTATRNGVTPTRSRKKKHGAKASPLWADLDTTAHFRDPNLIIHSNVYALGEQYAVEGLKAMALEKFIAEAKVHWATEDFLQAVEHVYSSTPEHDRGLRDVVRNTFYEHRRELMDRENVKPYLRDVQDFAYDVLMHMWKEGV
ncbi:hypothetical protein CONLIGDRAFT_587322, partial [Coniochaeta ligniaria NRRL 30616]